MKEGGSSMALYEGLFTKSSSHVDETATFADELEPGRRAAGFRAIVTKCRPRP